MNTETKSENPHTTIDNKTNNKALFGPLGKYAIAGVIMVSIIITTAIVLNKQLGTTPQDIAAIEKEFAESYAAELTANESAASITTTLAIESENNPVQDAIEVAEIEVTPVEIEPAVIHTAVIHTGEVPAADANKILAATETTGTVTTEEKISDKNLNTEQTPSTAQVTTTESVKTDTVVTDSAQTPLPQLVADKQNQQWLTRIQTHKLEQKQRMTEMFGRIKSLESQHLDRYKIHQDKQIGRLREQIAHQQELIEELILRNKRSFEMREASMQRHQTNREQMLNRI